MKISIKPIVLISLILGLVGCKLTVDDGAKKVSTSNSDSLVNRIEQTGVSGCGIVEAFNERDQALKAKFIKKLSAYLWAEEKCVANRDIISFGGSHLKLGSVFALGISSQGCFNKKMENPLESLIPKGTQKLKSYYLSEGSDLLSNRRLLSWVVEESEGKVACFILPVHIFENMIKVGDLQKTEGKKESTVSLIEFMENQKWQTFLKSELKNPVK